MNDQEFKFSIRDRVKLALSGEAGIVVGRAQYQAAENGYLVRYVAADGRQVETWFGSSLSLIHI